MPLDLRQLTETEEISEAGARGTLSRLLAQLAARLPTEIVASKLSRVSKYPYKAAVLDAALGRRTLELSRATMDLVDRGQDLPAAFTSRGVMETAALILHLARRLERAVSERRLGDTDDFLMRGLVGWNAPYSTWRPLSVSTAIDHAEKQVPQFKERYSFLCDVVHPNWMGTHASFVQQDERVLKAAFGRREPIGWQPILVSLLLSVALSIHASSRVEDVLPGFVELSEKQVSRRGT